MTGTPIFREKCVFPALADMDKQSAPASRLAASIPRKIFLLSILATFHTIFVAVINLNPPQNANPDNNCKRCNFILQHCVNSPENATFQTNMQR